MSVIYTTFLIVLKKLLFFTDVHQYRMFKAKINKNIVTDSKNKCLCL